MTTDCENRFRVELIWDDNRVTHTQERHDRNVAIVDGKMTSDYNAGTRLTPRIIGQQLQELIPGYGWCDVLEDDDE